MSVEDGLSSLSNMEKLISTWEEERQKQFYKDVYSILEATKGKNGAHAEMVVMYAGMRVATERGKKYKN